MVNLTDQDFEQFLEKADKPVLVDFWATWCGPCNVLSPILEKLAQEYEDKIILAEVNVDEARQTAQKFGINQIPTVILFKNGKPISGFIGVRPEPTIKEMLDKMLEDSKKEEKKEEEGEIEETEEKKEETETEEDSKKGEKEEMIKWYEDYAKKNGFRLNPDKEAVERLIKGLLANEKKYGARYCPCRRVTGNIEEDRPKICPCQFMRKEIEEQGHCLCGLFFKKDYNL